jgi:hypothetical protein
MICTLLINLNLHTKPLFPKSNPLLVVSLPPCNCDLGRGFNGHHYRGHIGSSPSPYERSYTDVVPINWQPTSFRTSMKSKTFLVVALGRLVAGQAQWCKQFSELRVPDSRTTFDIL